MINKVKNIFSDSDRHVVFLTGFYWSYFLLMVLGVIIDYLVGHYIDSYIAMIFLILSLLLYTYYLKSAHFEIAKNGLILLATLSTYALLVSNDYQTSYFHIIVPLTYFLLFSLKDALLITAIHIIFLVIIYVLGYTYLPQINPFPRYIILFGVGLASLAVILFGILYHVSIENSYKRLEVLHKQNEALLQEVHHRVKNNLNIISSLLGMQQIKQKNNHTISDLLQKNRNRIDTIAMVHETLYAHNNFEKIELYEYLYNLSHMILEANDEREIILKIQENHLQLPFEKVLKIGIITNELLINSLKYAFNDTESGIIEIFFRNTDTELHYHYKDNGSQEVNTSDSSDHGSLGLRLIHMMADQMDAIVETAYNHGLHYTIRIPHAT